MAGESKKILKEIEDFNNSSVKLGTKIKEVGDDWKDENYTSLRTQVAELAKSSKTVVESGKNTCSCIEKFFSIAAEDVK